jgi:hypothetical protein
MPFNPNGCVVRSGPDDVAAHDQLQHRVVVETHWPSDRQFDIDSLGDGLIRQEEYPTAAEVNSAPATAPETGAPAKLVTYLKCHPVPILLPSFALVVCIHDLCRYAGASRSHRPHRLQRNRRSKAGRTPNSCSGCCNHLTELVLRTVERTSMTGDLRNSAPSA